MPIICQKDIVCLWRTVVSSSKEREKCYLQKGEARKMLCMLRTRNNKEQLGLLVLWNSRAPVRQEVLLNMLVIILRGLESLWRLIFCGAPRGVSLWRMNWRKRCVLTESSVGGLTCNTKRPCSGCMPCALGSQRGKTQCYRPPQTLAQLSPWWKCRSSPETQHIDCITCQNKNKDLSHQSPSFWDSP